MIPKTFKKIAAKDRAKLKHLFDNELKYSEEWYSLDKLWGKIYGHSLRVQLIYDFIEQLIVPSGKGKGKPFVLRDFQKHFIYDIYEKVNKKGSRIVLRAILSMSRKNGKSMLIAALVLVHLVGPESTENGEIYGAANEREQAAIIFRYCSQIVRKDAELSSIITVVPSTKTMVCFENGSTYKAVSAEAGTKHGYNPTVIIYDELSQAKNTALYEAFDTSMGARIEAGEDPLFVVISTQSKDPQQILSVLITDGVKNEEPTTVCHLYTTAIPENSDEDDCLTNEAKWYDSNPALNDFRSLTEMRAFAQKAIRMPSFENTFRNLYLNQCVDQHSPLIPRAEWQACQGDATIELGSDIYLGLDLSGKTDLTALVGVSDDDSVMTSVMIPAQISLLEFKKKYGVIPEQAQEHFEKKGKLPEHWVYDADPEEKWVRHGGQDRIKAWFWKPEASLDEHEKRDRVPYKVWVKQGFIETTPGRAIQYDWIAQRLALINKDYNIKGMAFDRYRIDDLMNAMGKIGLDCYVDGKDEARAGALRLVPWGQGFASMGPAVEALEGSVLDRKLVHDGHPCLTWNIANAMPVGNAVGEQKLDKSRSRFRIDGAVALTMALGLKSRDHKAGPQQSAYENNPEAEIMAW